MNIFTRDEISKEFSSTRILKQEHYYYIIFGCISKTERVLVSILHNSITELGRGSMQMSDRVLKNCVAIIKSVIITSK